MENLEDNLHELARLFMYQFPELELMSLDEFLYEYETGLTEEQKELGYAILNMFN
jgi:hypothetical protein